MKIGRENMPHTLGRTHQLAIVSEVRRFKNRSAHTLSLAVVVAVVIIVVVGDSRNARANVRDFSARLYIKFARPGQCDDTASKYCDGDRVHSAYLTRLIVCRPRVPVEHSSG